MKAKFQIERPAELEATMTLTMSLKEWEQLRVQLSDAWPSWDLSVAIDSVVRAANKHFNVDTSVDAPAPKTVIAQPAPKPTFDTLKTGPQPGDLDYDGPPSTSEGDKCP